MHALLDKGEVSFLLIGTNGLFVCNLLILFCFFFFNKPLAFVERGKLECAQTLPNPRPPPPLAFSERPTNKVIPNQEKMGGRGRVGTMTGICEFLKNYFQIGKIFPRRPRLFRMTADEFIWHCVKVFGVVFSIHQAVRFTRNCRICLQLQDLGQDKPISLLLKPFSSNKRLFHMERHFEFSNFADLSGTRLPFSCHLKIA